jgi:hypothetical protein
MAIASTESWRHFVSTGYDDARFEQYSRKCHSSIARDKGRTSWNIWHHLHSVSINHTRSTADVISVTRKIFPLKHPKWKTSLYEDVAFHIDRYCCVTQSRAAKSLFHFHPGHYVWRSIRGRFPAKRREVDEKCGRGKLKRGNFGNKMIPRQVRTRAITLRRPNANFSLTHHKLIFMP